MAKVTFDRLFDFTKVSGINQGTAAIEKLDKVYIKLIKDSEKGRTATVKSMNDIEKAAKPLSDQLNKLSSAIKKEREEILLIAENSSKLVQVKEALKGKTIKLTGSIDNLKKEQAKFNEKARETQRLVREEAKLRAKLSTVTGTQSKKVAELRVEVANANKATRQAAKESLKLVTIYEKESKRLIVLRDNHRKLALEQGVSSTAAKLAAKEHNNLKNKLLQIDDATGNYVRRIGGYRQALGGLTAGFRQLASALGFAGIIFGIIAVFRDAFRTLRDFDKELTNLSAIAGKSKREMKGVSDEIKRIGRTSVNTALDVAKTATALISLGKSRSEVIDLLKPVNDLSIALRAPADAAGELLIKTLNAFGESSESAQEFADIIAKIRASTALDFEKIKDALGFLAPTAKAAGLSFARTGAILGVLVDNGIKAARAGRLMSSSFLRLAEKGLTLQQALIKLNEVQSTTSNELILLRESSSLFGKESAALGLILASNIDNIDKYNQAFDDAGGTLDELTEKQLTSLDSQLKILNATWDDFILGIDSGEGAVAGLVKSLVLGGIAIIDFFNKVNNLGRNTFEAFEDGIKTGELMADMLGNDLSPSIEQTTKELKAAKEALDFWNLVAADVDHETAVFANEIARLEGVLSSLTDAEEKNARILKEKEKAEAKLVAIAKKEIELNKQRTAALAELNIKFEEGTISIKQMQAAIDEFDFNAEARALSNLNDEIDDLINSGGAIADFADEDARALKDATDQAEDYYETILDGEEKSALIRQTVFDSAEILGNQFFTNNQIRLDNEIKALQDQKAQELALVGDNAEAKAQIEAKFAAKEKQIRRKQAQDNKNQALFNIAINTAQAILQAIAQFGPPPSPAGIAGIAAAGIIGAVQAAAVISQPLPAFEKGGIMERTGLAQVSEKGPELIVGPKGNISLTGDKGPELREVEGGSQILTNTITERILSLSGKSAEDNNESSAKLINIINDERNGIITRQFAKIIGKENDFLADEIKKAIEGLPVHVWDVRHSRLVDTMVQGNSKHNDWQKINSNR